MMWNKALGELSAMKGNAAPAVPHLIEALRARTAVAAEIAGTLGEIGPPARSSITALVECLREGENKLREQAAEAIGKIGCDDPNALTALDQRLYDPEPAVRTAAAGAIGSFGRMAVPFLGHLHALLNDVDTSVRARAATSILQLDPSATSALEMLLQIVSKGQDFKAQIVAGHGFATFGSANAALAPALIGAVANDETRAVAIQSLGRIGKGAYLAIPILREVAQSTQDVQIRLLASFAIWQISGDLRLLDHAVQEGSHSNSNGFRAAVFETIGRMGREGTPFVALLKDSLDGQQPIAVRATAAQALWAVTGEIQPALTVLLDCLRDQTASRDERLTAMLGLEEMGGDAEQAAPLLEELMKRDTGLFECVRAYNALKSVSPRAAAGHSLPCLRQHPVNNLKGTRV